MLSRRASSLSDLCVDLPDGINMLNALYSLYKTRRTTMSYPSTLVLSANSLAHQPEGIKKALEMSRPPSSYQIESLTINGEQAFYSIPELLPYCTSKLVHLSATGDTTTTEGIVLLSKLIHQSSPSLKVHTTATLLVIYLIYLSIDIYLIHLSSNHSCISAFALSPFRHYIFANAQWITRYSISSSPTVPAYPLSLSKEGPSTKNPRWRLPRNAPV